METLKNNLLETLINNGDIDICSQYGERGYSLSEGKKAILFANWNNMDKYPNFMEWIEDNYEIEWSDEWIIDYDNDKVYRTSPDSYSWQQQFRITEYGELITPDNDVTEWIEYCKVTPENLPHTPQCIPDFINVEDLESEGFELISEDHENGWYGRNDSPTIIADSVFEQTNYTEILFILSNVGQFSINFDVYAR